MVAQRHKASFRPKIKVMKVMTVLSGVRAVASVRKIPSAGIKASVLLQMLYLRVRECQSSTPGRRHSRGRTPALQARILRKSATKQQQRAGAAERRNTFRQPQTPPSYLSGLPHPAGKLTLEVSDKALPAWRAETGHGRHPIEGHALFILTPPCKPR